MKKLLLTLLFAMTASSCIMHLPATETRTGEFLVYSYDENGRMKQFWSVSGYKLNLEDMSVTFTVDGVTHTLKGSYEINELITP